MRAHHGILVVVLTSMFSSVISPAPTSKYLRVSAMSDRERDRERGKEREYVKGTEKEGGKGRVGWK